MIHDYHFKGWYSLLTDEKGYNAIVRNSGGLGVVLDQGVLNISLMFKGQTETTIDEAFTVMYLLIAKMFEDEDVDIDTHEIERSYCPGKFDLSIDGRNLPVFLNDACVAELLYRYICVEGSGSERALMMKDFMSTHLKVKQQNSLTQTLNPIVWLHLRRYSTRCHTIVCYQRFRWTLKYGPDH